MKVKSEKERENDRRRPAILWLVTQLLNVGDQWGKRDCVTRPRRDPVGKRSLGEGNFERRISAGFFSTLDCIQKELHVTSYFINLY